MKVFRSFMLMALAVSACSHVETRSPAGVDLSGTWELDPRHSDSPPPLGRRSRSQMEDADGTGTTPGGAPPRYGGPLPLLTMVTATEMVIAQDALSMGIEYPNQPYRDVKWGTQKRGLYTIDAGWEKEQLLVETKSKPMNIKETYSLNPSGNTLTLKIDLNGERMEDRHVTRVFTRKIVDPVKDPQSSQPAQVQQH